MNLNLMNRNLNPNRNLMSLSLMNPTLPTNPIQNRPNLIPMNRSLMSLIRPRQTRLRPSQVLPSKRIEKRREA